jgi:hypothetical protein
MAFTFSKISGTLLNSNATTISVTNIPNTYDALMFYLSVRSDLNAPRTNVVISLNNNTSNYIRSEIYLENDSFGIEANYTNNTTGGMNASQANSGLFTNIVGFLPNYKTSNDKVAWIRNGQPNNTSASYGLWQTFYAWKDSSVVSSIYATAGSGNIVAGSELIVYGIKYS